jgi:hypothetical protein
MSHASVVRENARLANLISGRPVSGRPPGSAAKSPAETALEQARGSGPKTPQEKRLERQRGVNPKKGD